MTKTETVKRDLSKSMAVVDKATPIIYELLGRPNYEFSLKRIEGDDNEICKTLDLSCGIDYLLQYTCNSITTVHGVGCRVQWVIPPAFNTFTIRNKRESGRQTEFEKIKHAIQKDSERPHLTMHIYTDKNTGEILSLGITKTASLIKYIEEHNVQTKITGADKIGQAEFFYVDFFNMQKFEPKTYIWIK